MNKNKKIVYFDMDGVLVNFQSGIDQLDLYHKIEIFIRNHRKVKTKIIDIKDIKKLPALIKKQVLQDLKKIISKRQFLKNKSHILMGVLNMTPDSFSDGGKFNNFKKSTERINYMLKAGADIIDVGGESTRPGSKIISPADELRRVKKVIEKFKKKFPNYLLSIDSRKSNVINHSIKKLELKSNS